MNKCRNTICYLLRKKKKKEPVTPWPFLIVAAVSTNTRLYERGRGAVSKE